MTDANSNLGAVAMGKAATLQALIDKLNSTTVGDLSDRIDSNNNDITVLSGRINSNDIDIANISDRIDSNNADIALINKKIDTVAAIFSIVFNSDGTLSSEEYSTHAHDYVDSTIADTEDGSGTQTDTTKTTAGVK